MSGPGAARMTADEHYTEAERLLRGCPLPEFEGGGFGAPSERDVAQALVHAVLALAVPTPGGSRG